MGSPEVQADLAGALIGIAAVEKGLDFFIRKPTVVNLLGGTLAKGLLKTGVRLYLISEFGSGAGPLFDQLMEIAGAIGELDASLYGSCELDEQLQALSDRLAQALLDYAREAGTDRLGGLVKKLNFRDNRRDKDDDDKYKNCSGNYPGPARGPKGPLIIPKCGKGKGHWSNPKKPGDSTWISEKTPGLRVKYRNGFPVFEPFAYTENGVKAIVQVEGLVGDQTPNGKDLTAADQAFRDLIGDQNWKRDKSKYTWHHHQDCKTMVLIPKKYHQQEIRHTGGAAFIRHGACK